MFSMLPTLHTYTQSHYYTPVHPSPLSSSPLRNSPSPLSPRNANVPSSPPTDHSPDTDSDCMMSSPSKTSRYYSPICTSHTDATVFQPVKKMNVTPPHATSTRGRESAYSKRTTKSNPLIHRSGGSTNEGRETRRKLFLKRVRDVAGEKRWKERGLGESVSEEEEVLRCIWIQEERKREERIQREAQLLGLEPTPEDVEEVEIDLNEEEMMAEEIALVDQREIEYYQMVGGAHGNIPMDQKIESRLPDMDNRAATASKTESLYGNDDDVYDEIFMDVFEEELRTSSQQVQPIPAYVDDHEMMDMS